MSISQKVLSVLEEKQLSLPGMEKRSKLAEIGDTVKGGYASGKAKLAGHVASGKAKLAGHVAAGKAKYGEQLAKHGKAKVYGATGLVGLAGAGGAYGAYRGLKSALTKTPSEKAQAMASNVKDVIKNKVMENPKAAAALGAAGVIGTGYGAYRYLKGRKKK